MLHSTTAWRLGVLSAIAVVLAACGGGTAAPAPTSPPAPVAVTREPPTARASTNVPAPPTLPPTTLAASASPAPTVPPTTLPPATIAPTVEAGIPRGRTAEGYHYLGNPDAPVTIQDFSDFL
jgi:hypothetical protein